MTAGDLSVIVWEVIAAFAGVGMHTHLLVCDGAGQNLKLFRGIAVGCINVHDELTTPWGHNPYLPANTDQRLFLIFDPAHMTKNFRNLLFASQQQNAKAFRARLDKGLWERRRAELLLS